MIRVVLVDDHIIMREGLRLLLSPETDICVVGEAHNGADVLAQLAQTPADVVVLDLHMPGMPGHDVTRHLQRQYPEVGVLVLSMASAPNEIAQALQAGARGYVLKSACLAEVAQGIRMVAAGQRFLCTEIGLAALYRARTIPAPAELAPHADAAGPSLTKRELEVLQLMSEGLSNQEMADQLFTSKRTVETHRQNIIAKTQSRNTADLIKLAVQKGLIG